MKAALFATARYAGPSGPGWPVAVDIYSSETAEKSYERSLELFGMADDYGFDWVTVAEHHYSGFSMTPNPMVMAGALTQKVRKAKIAVLGPNIPILNPVRVAEEYAMLDTLTGGRVIAGMMRGTANEYVTYNTNPSESHDRFYEALQLILKAWTEPQPFGWQGRFYEYRSISIWPRPVQQPHPPIYMSGSGPEANEFAAQNRLGVGFAATRIPLAAEAARYYREQAHAIGWDPTPEDLLYRVATHVADTDDQAIEDLRPREDGVNALRYGLSRANPAVEQAVAQAGYYGRDAETQRDRAYNRDRSDVYQRIENGQLLAGSPETVFTQIKRIRDEVGAGVLDLTFLAPERDLAVHAVELFGAKVLPRIREL